MLLTGEFVSFGEERDEEIARGVQDNWPHAYAKFDCTADEFIETMNCNHIHAVYGDWTEELITFCEIKGIDWVLIG